MAGKGVLTGALLSMQGGSQLSQAAPRLRRRFAWALLGAAALHALFFAELGRSWRAPPAPASRVTTALWVQEPEPVARVAPVTQVPQPLQAPQIGPPDNANPPRRALVPGSNKASRVEPSAPPSVSVATASPAGLSATAPPPDAQPAEPAVTPTQLAASVADKEPGPVVSTLAAPHPAEPAAASAPDNVPVYATQVPAPAILQYRMRRGMVHGNAELTWRLDAGHYEARLEARASGVTLLTQVSQGDVAATGLAPQRFTDKRVRRSAVAANFQREGGAGKISFSGSELDLVLHAGTQDRLSWMVQLAAIASAQPQLLAAHGKIAMHVVGARGDAAVWRFQSSGEETIGASPLAIRVVRLQRLPQTPYDTHVDVWLDAAPPHWPVRAKWRNGPQDSAMEMWRIDVTEPR